MKYKHKNDSGFDLYAAETVTIPPHDFGIVPTDFSSDYVTDAVETEQDTRIRFVGWGLYLWPKSGSDWLIGGGVVDIDYDDYVLVKVANIKSEPLTIEEGQKVCQGVIAPVYQDNTLPRGEPRHKTGGIKDQYVQ